MSYLEPSKDEIRQDLALDAANIASGVQQMVDMVEWLEMNTVVKFDWSAWIEGYEECPVDDCHHYEGDHKGLFIEMIEHCNDFDACLEAWYHFSEITGTAESDGLPGAYALCDSADLEIKAVDSFGNISLSGTYKGHDVKVEININGCDEPVNSRMNIRELTRIEFNAIRVLVDGDVDFQYGELKGKS